MCDVCDTVNYGLVLGRSLIITHGPIFDALAAWAGFLPCNNAFSLKIGDYGIMVSDADFGCESVVAPESVVDAVVRGIISGMWTTLHNGGSTVSRMTVREWREWAQEVSK